VSEGALVGQPVQLMDRQKREILRIYDNPAGTRRAIIGVGRDGDHRDSSLQTDPPDRLLDRSRPEAALQHPTSPIQHRTLLPQRALRPLQNQTVLRYTLSASGLP